MSPLCEIIEPIDDESESMALLIDRWVAFDQSRSGLEKWLTQFGDETTSSNLMTKVDASGSIDQVNQNIEEVILQIVERKKQKESLLRSTIQSVLIKEEEAEAEK